jgi:hypothetical protein
MTDLYSEILEFEKMKNIDRKQLVEDYAHLIVEGMDMDTLVSFAYDTMLENLTDYTDEELLTEVTDYYPELLENVETL